jgi:hypothetical protein
MHLSKVPSKGERRKARITRLKFEARPHLSAGQWNSAIRIYGKNRLLRPVRQMRQA